MKNNLDQFFNNNYKELITFTKRVTRGWDLNYYCFEDILHNAIIQTYKQSEMDPDKFKKMLDENTLINYIGSIITYSRYNNKSKLVQVNETNEDYIFSQCQEEQYDLDNDLKLTKAINILSETFGDDLKHLLNFKKDVKKYYEIQKLGRYTLADNNLYPTEKLTTYEQIEYYKMKGLDDEEIKIKTNIQIEIITAKTNKKVEQVIPEIKTKNKSNTGVKRQEKEIDVEKFKLMCVDEIHRNIIMNEFNLCSNSEYYYYVKKYFKQGELTKLILDKDYNLFVKLYTDGLPISILRKSLKHRSQIPNYKKRYDENL